MQLELLGCLLRAAHRTVPPAQLSRDLLQCSASLRFVQGCLCLNLCLASSSPSGSEPLEFKDASLRLSFESVV